MLDQALYDAIRQRLRDAEFARWLGMDLTSLDDGTSEITLMLEPHHLNPGGIAHGGVIASLLDAAIGLALRTRLGMTATHVTVQLNVNYLRAIRRGKVIARGSAVHSGARVGYGEATLHDEMDRLLAKATATFLVVEDPNALPGDVRA